MRRSSSRRRRPLRTSLVTLCYLPPEPQRQAKNRPCNTVLLGGGRARRGGVVRVERRSRAGAPQAPVEAAGGARGLEERRGVAAAVVVVEPDGRRAPADELDVQVGRPAEDVAQQAPVAVDLVEPRVGL